MHHADLATVLDWTADDRCNPGFDDAAAFLAADPAGFFVAEQQGRPIAAMSMVNHDAQMAFLGLYLRHLAFRGQGIGYALWTRAMLHAGARTIGLDGVAARQANYAKSGFVACGAKVCMQGQLAPSVSHLRDAQPVDQTALAALDRHANEYDRAAILAAWTTPTRTRITVVTDKPHGITGFATARLCRNGCKIGPVTAPGTATAMILLHATATRIGTSMITVDIPQTNAALIAVLTTAGFTETFRTARMHRGSAPPTRPALQAISTIKLG